MGVREPPRLALLRFGQGGCEPLFFIRQTFDNPVMLSGNAGMVIRARGVLRFFELHRQARQSDNGSRADRAMKQVGHFVHRHVGREGLGHPSFDVLQGFLQKAPRAFWSQHL